MIHSLYKIWGCNARKKQRLWLTHKVTLMMELNTTSIAVYSRNNAMYCWNWIHGFRMIKILFVCHGSILKSSGKDCKINDFMGDMALATPLLHHFGEES